MQTISGKKISLEEFNRIMDEHADYKKNGYKIKNSKFYKKSVSKYETPIDMYTIRNQITDGLFEWGKKISNFSSAFNSKNCCYTDLKIAFAEPHSEEDVKNRKEKYKVDREVKKVDYNSIYESIDRTIEPEELEYIKRMKKLDKKKTIRVKKNIDKNLEKNDLLFEEMKIRLNL